MDTLAQLLRDLKQLEHQRLTVGMSSSESRKLHTTEKPLSRRWKKWMCGRQRQSLPRKCPSMRRQACVTTRFIELILHLRQHMRK